MLKEGEKKKCKQSGLHIPPNFQQGKERVSSPLQAQTGAVGDSPPV